MGVGCGLPAWIGEAEQPEGGSQARRQRRCKQGVKVSTWKGVHHGLGRRLFGGGVDNLGGRCRARAGGQGMWDVEGGGGWGSGVDYLPG